MTEQNEQIVHLFDIALSTLALRLIFGWLSAYTRLVRMVLTVLGMGLVLWCINYYTLPFATVLSVVLLIPLFVVVVMSYLPELAKLYQSASRGNLFGLKRHQHVEAVPEIRDAIMELVAKRNGAILVFPQGDDAETLMNGGETVDAEVNGSLLVSIFNPSCPRHDGATVIENGRIARIGAVLPLASAEGADAKLGTRHLAAIGLSEQCDADLLVISEERGTISHAYRGKLVAMKESGEEQVEDLLRNILGSSTEKGSTTRGTFSLALWLGALLLSTFASYEIPEIIERWTPEDPPQIIVERQIKADVLFARRPEGTYTHGLKALRETLVVLRMPDGTALDDSLKMTIDLSQLEPGQGHTITYQESMLDLPEEVTVERFDPAQLKFQLLKVREQELAVKVPKVEGLPEEFELVKVSLIQPRINVEVSDPKWSAKVITPSKIDLSGVKDAGILGFKAKLELPPYVKPRNLPDAQHVDVQVEVKRKEVPVPPDEPEPSSP